MAYADYAFYKGTYKGSKLSENAFEQFSERASDYIDSRTEDAFSEGVFPSGLVELKVKKACCAVAEAYKTIENGGGKAAESVDGYSVTYAAGSKAKSADELLDTAIKLYLSDYIKAVRWI